jgi:thymidylate kinase
MQRIVITGADASGKDTQIASLEKHFLESGQKVQKLAIWDSLADFSKVSDKKVLNEILDSFLMKFEPHARSLFLMSCLRNSLDKIHGSVDVVLINGFIYKYWASEMSYGVESAFWKANSEFFLKPDRVIYIKTPVEQCLSRRNEWSKYESGLARSLMPQKLSFREFQASVHKNMNLVLSTISDVITIDGSSEIPRVFTQLQEQM